MLEISKKKDILIPFETIGEAGWEIKTKTILESYADLWENDLPEPVTQEKLQETEQRLEVKLPEALKTFYKTFGIADIGEELIALEEMAWIYKIGENNPYAPDFTEEDQKILPYLISFSDYLGNGNMFCFHCETQEIYYYDHDTSPYITRLFDKVDDYLKGCLISLQSQLPSEDADEEKVEEWVESILNKTFGKKVIRKWKY